MIDPAERIIYQLKVVLLGISPMIWRRVKAHDPIAGIVERAGELAGLPFRVHAHMLPAWNGLLFG